MSGSSPPSQVEAPDSLATQMASLTRLVSDQQQQIAKLLSDGQPSDDSESGSLASKSYDGGTNDFDDMLKSLNQPNDGNQLDAEFEEALADLEDSNEFGSEIQQGIAAAFIKTVTRPLSKESKEKLKKRVLIPANCKVMVPPKVNQEIWCMLPTKSRLIDLQTQQVQISLASGISTFATMSDELAKLTGVLPKETVNRLLKNCMDTANLLGSQLQDLNRKRKQAIKPHISPEYAGICSMEIPPGEFLFGSNLTDSLKATKATSSLIRQTSGARARYKPYSNPQKSGSLNWNAPFQQRARWNGPQDRRYQQTKQSPQQQQFRQGLGRPPFNRRN